MALPTLALFHRSLREDVRQFRPHLLRFLFVAFIFTAMAVAHLTSSVFGAPGLQFFRSISYLNFAFITLAAISYFATAVTEEKDEQTLGLLKMAGMSSAGLLLGKSTTRLIATAIVLAAQLPFTLLAVTLGGVTLAQVVAVYIALAAYMVLCANLGLFCSVYARGSGQAAAMTGVILLLILAAPPLSRLLFPAGLATGAGGNVVSATDALWRWLHETSVWARLQQILTTGFNGEIWSVQASSNLLAAATLFVLSCIMFEPLTREGDSRLRLWWRHHVGRRLQRRTRRSLRAGDSPFVWKEFQFGVGGRRGLVVRAAVYAAAALAIGSVAATFGQNLPRAFGSVFADPGAAVALLALAAAGVELALQSARVFRDEVRQGTLPTLVLLPHPISRAAWAKAAGCLLVVIPPLLLFTVALGVSPLGVGTFLEQFVLTRHGWLAFVQVLLVLFLTAWLSLIVRWGALPLALGIVYVLIPAVGYLLLMPVAAMTGTFGSALVVWELVCVPLDALAGVAMLFINRDIGRRLTELAGR